MFSLIITIVAIALVALLALATLYYGSSAFQKGDAAAKAAKLLNEGQQLLGASDLYRADTGNWPDSISALVAGNYLTAQPGNKVSLLGFEFMAPQLGLSSAIAADAVSSAWVMPKAGNPTFYIAQANGEVCAEVNRKSYGVNGVLSAPRTHLINQCYGLGSPEFTVLVSKEPAGLSDIPPISEVVISAPIPTDSSSSEWSVKPGAGAGGATGGGSSDGGNSAIPVPKPQPPTPPANPTASLWVEDSLYLVSAGVGKPVTRTLTIWNDGPDAAAPVIEVSAPFVISENLCQGATLQYNDACDVSVTYTPTSDTTAAGWLMASANTAPAVYSALKGASEKALNITEVTLPLTAAEYHPEFGYQLPPHEVVSVISGVSETQRGDGRYYRLKITNPSNVATGRIMYRSDFHEIFLDQSFDVPSTCSDVSGLAPGESCYYTVEPRFTASMHGEENIDFYDYGNSGLSIRFILRKP